MVLESESLLAAKDLSPSPQFACSQEPYPMKPASGHTQPATSPPGPPTVLGTLLPSGPAKFDSRVTIQNIAYVKIKERKMKKK